jgi:hypothetical protein
MSLELELSYHYHRTTTTPSATPSRLPKLATNVGAIAITVAVFTAPELELVASIVAVEVTDIIWGLAVGMLDVMMCTEVDVDIEGMGCIVFDTCSVIVETVSVVRTVDVACAGITVVVEDESVMYVVTVA